MSEERLRLIEALTRTDGTMARADPKALISSVEILYDYVISGVSQRKADVSPQVKVETPSDAEFKIRRRSKRR